MNCYLLIFYIKILYYVILEKVNILLISYTKVNIYILHYIPIFLFNTINLLLYNPLKPRTQRLKLQERKYLLLLLKPEKSEINYDYCFR